MGKKYDQSCFECGWSGISEDMGDGPKCPECGESIFFEADSCYSEVIEDEK